MLLLAADVGAADEGRGCAATLFSNDAAVGSPVSISAARETPFQ